MTYELKVGDYVKFTRVIAPAIKKRNRSSFGGNFDIEVTPRRLVDQGGSGQIMSMAKNRTSIDDERVRTARVDAGPWLGNVVAVIDDAILVGKQIVFDIAEEEVVAQSMYGTDVRGGA